LNSIWTINVRSISVGFFAFENYLLPHKVLNQLLQWLQNGLWMEIGGVYDNIHDVVMY
jgi:hypothetical protein